MLTASNKVLTENFVACLGQTDCGYEGCVHSCVDSLQEQHHELSEMVPCSNKSWAHDVVLEEGCNEHPEVCSETLVLCLCKTLAKDLQGKFRKIFNEGKSLAYQTLGGPSVTDPILGKNVFILSVKTAVSLTRAC